jgi:hypothetical protein
MPIEGFIVLAFLPSPEFLLLTIAWDWVLHYSIQNIYSWPVNRRNYVLGLFWEERLKAI